MKAFTLRVPEWLHDEATELFDSLGMNMSTALNVFLRQCVINRGSRSHWSTTRSGTGSRLTTAISSGNGAAAFDGRPPAYRERIRRASKWSAANLRASRRVVKKSLIGIGFSAACRFDCDPVDSGARRVKNERRNTPPRRRIQPLLGGNQIADFGEKVSAEEIISGSSGASEDENRLEIAQLMPSCPMGYNANIRNLSCGNARVSFRICEN